MCFLEEGTNLLDETNEAKKVVLVWFEWLTFLKPVDSEANLNYCMIVCGCTTLLE